MAMKQFQTKSFQETGERYTEHERKDLRIIIYCILQNKTPRDFSTVIQLVISGRFVIDSKINFRSFQVAKLWILVFLAVKLYDF